MNCRVKPSNAAILFKETCFLSRTVGKASLYGHMSDMGQFTLLDKSLWAIERPFLDREQAGTARNSCNVKCDRGKRKYSTPPVRRPEWGPDVLLTSGKKISSPFFSVFSPNT